MLTLRERVLFFLVVKLKYQNVLKGFVGNRSSSTWVVTL